MKKFNHAFSIMFTVETTNHGQEVTERELINGLQKRLSDLKKVKGEIIEACGFPDDTYTFEEE